MHCNFFLLSSRICKIINLPQPQHAYSLSPWLFCDSNLDENQLVFFHLPLSSKIFFLFLFLFLILIPPPPPPPPLASVAGIGVVHSRKRSQSLIPELEKKIEKEIIRRTGGQEKNTSSARSH
jgi:hypothetical protein